MIKSKKFQFLEEFEVDPFFKGHIPESLDIESNILFDKKTKYILRSALINESTDTQMNSGKSYSQKDIRTKEDLANAIERARLQPDLAQIVLQVQFEYEFHLTLYIQEELCLFQYQNDQDNKTSLGSLTPTFRSGKFPYSNLLEIFYEQWIKNKKRKEGVVIEMGMTSRDFKIFQIIPAPLHIIQRIFNDDLFVKMIKTRNNFAKKRSFFSLLKLEIEAKNFRDTGLKNKADSLSLTFKNWEFIFNYFYYFCQIKKKKGLDQDFVDFLNFSQQHQKNWMAKIIHQHLQLSGCIRALENIDGTNELPSMFKTQGQTHYFLGGHGLIEGKLKDIGIKIEHPTPEFMYQAKPDKIIFTPNCELLGHAFLVAAEKNVPIVANFEYNSWKALSDEDYLLVDFNLKRIVVKIL